MKKVLVISPHPDDESVGCGGTIRKHVVEGDFVEVIFITSGERGGHGMPPKETAITREREAKNAANVLGYNKIEFWKEPNGKLRLNDHLIERMVKKINESKPDIIYVTHEKEMHPEHQACARLIKKIFEKKLTYKIKPTVYMYEVWTPIQKIDHIVDITPYISIKRKAIKAHKCQCAVMNFEEAFLGLNRYRGEMHSWPGGEYAEIFSALKI